MTCKNLHKCRQTDYYRAPGFGSMQPVMIYQPRILGPESRTAFVLCHSDDDYIEFLPAPELAKRGYTVIATHVRESQIPLEEKMLQVGQVVDFIKNYPGIDKVLLLGHSGGATLMSAYQNVAENGNATFQGPERIYKLPEIAKLTPADGVVLMDSNYGNGAMSLMSIDPAIVDENTGEKDPELDLYNPANGFDPEGCHYSDAFMRKFWTAQAERMNRLIAYCQERVALIDAGKGRFVDDEPISIPGGTQFGPVNKMVQQVPSVLSHTKEERDLLHADGTITHEIVHCLRGFNKGMNAANSYKNILNTSVRTFLASSALKADPSVYALTEDEMVGCDWRSSYCTTIGNVDGIHVPFLTMGMTGSHEYLASEHIIRRVASEDKTVCFVEAAGHNFELARHLKGQYPDPVKACFDYVAEWTGARF